MCIILKLNTRSVLESKIILLKVKDGQYYVSRSLFIFHYSRLRSVYLVGLNVLVLFLFIVHNIILDNRY